MFHQNIVFSIFLTNEITTSKNIKDRLNRQHVTKLLNKILEKSKTIINTNGLFIYAGINKFGENIFEIIEPICKCDIFYYNCGNKFNIDIIQKYMVQCENKGTIIFANGNECVIYKYENQFIKFKHLNAHLVNRQKKGGQSAQRYERIAENSRHVYVIHIIDYLNQLQTTNNIIYGSNEIVNMILNRKELLLKVKNGGFLEFNLNTINDTQKWIKMLITDNNYDKYYEEILLYLNTNVDMLDFDLTNKINMKYYIHISDKNINDKNIPLLQNSKLYCKLNMFEYIGVKYYTYIDEEIN